MPTVAILLVVVQTVAIKLYSYIAPFSLSCKLYIASTVTKRVSKIIVMKKKSWSSQVPPRLNVPAVSTSSMQQLSPLLLPHHLPPGGDREPPRYRMDGPGGQMDNRSAIGVMGSSTSAPRGTRIGEQRPTIDRPGGYHKMDTGKTEPPISAARGTRIVEQRPIRIGASGDHHKPYTADIMFNNIERTYPSVVADADHTLDARPTRSGDTSPGNLGFQFQHRPGIGGIVMGTTPTRQPTIGVTDHGIVGGTDLRSNDVGGTNVGGTNHTPNAGHCTPNVKPNVWGTHHRQTNRTPNVRGTDHTPDIGRTDQGIDHRGRETVSAEATDHWPRTVRKIRSDIRAERKETLSNHKDTNHRQGSGDLAVPQQVPETEPERMVNSKLSSTGHDSEGELKAGVKHVAMVPLRNKKQQMQVTYTAGG